MELECTFTACVRAIRVQQDKQQDARSNNEQLGGISEVDESGGVRTHLLLHEQASQDH